MEKYTCPCCGYKTLNERNSYDICEICFWEDDPVQSGDAEYVWGANYTSLYEAQQNYLEFGACERNMLSHVRAANIYDIRDRNWEPILKK